MSRRAAILATTMLVFSPYVWTQWVQTAIPGGGTVTCFARYASRLVAGSGGVIESTTDGSTWTSYSPGPSSVISLATFTSYLFAGTTSGGVWRTNDGGLTWTATSPGWTIPVYALAAYGTVLLAGTSGGVVVSSNAGDTWMASNTSLKSLQIRALTVDGSAVYAGTDSGVYRSSDVGSTWIACSPNSISHVNTLIVNGGDMHHRMPGMFAGTGLGGEIFRSSDHGETWQKVTINGITNPVISLIWPSDRYLLAGFAGYSRGPSVGRGVYISTDLGTSWTPTNEGLLDTSVSVLGVSGEYILAGTEHRGLWRRPINEVVTGFPEATGASPLHYTLLQNSPNPFNPTTLITYQLPAVSDVRLVVYDILGRHVALLVNERKGPGSYMVRFDAAGLASGMYLYRLTAGSFVQTKKMTIIR